MPRFVISMTSCLIPRWSERIIIYFKFEWSTLIKAERQQQTNAYGLEHEKQSRFQKYHMSPSQKKISTVLHGECHPFVTIYDP